jgi:outer membrane lipopolysaccharide assembly protein LptE/RlpB
MIGYTPRLALLLITLLLAACGSPLFDRMDLEAVVFRNSIASRTSSRLTASSGCECFLSGAPPSSTAP